MLLATLPRADFYRLIKMKPDAARARVHLGITAFAFGLKRNVSTGTYFTLDAIAWLMTSALGSQIGLRQAAEAIRLSSDAWLRALIVVEKSPEGMPDAWHMVIGVGVSRNKPGRLQVGPRHEVETALASFEHVRSVSINASLRQLRENAQEVDVPLPDRLTIDFDDPRYSAWRKEIEEVRKRGLANYEDKLRIRRARRAASALELA